MKNKILYLIIFLGYINITSSQTVALSIKNGNTQLFSKSIFCFGIKSNTNKTTLCIYKLNTKLQLIDSLIVNIQKDDYLQLYSDTLHNYLNIYLQKRNKNALAIFRLNSKPKIEVVIDNVDIARLNTISDFESEVLRYQNQVYTIKYVADTSGKQFYVNKYNLKNMYNNFEYEKIWQFPFERKNINTAHLIFSNKVNLFLYVNVLGGTKNGQWILKLNANTGKLNKATKLNDKTETNFYQFGNYAFDTISQTLHLIGQKFTEIQFNQTKNNLNITNQPFAQVYYSQIDSSGKQILKQDFKIPIIEPKTANKKPIANYIFKINKLEIDKEGDINFETDIFKSTNLTLCFNYCNTKNYKLITSDGQLVLDKNTLQANPLIETYLATTDNLDMNGKLCVDSLNYFETIYYKSILFPTKLNFKTDEVKNPAYLLQKTDTKKGIVNYSLISPVNKIYKLQKIEDILKTENPLYIGISNSQFIISRQLDLDNYQLKIYNW